MSKEIEGLEKLLELYDETQELAISAVTADESVLIVLTPLDLVLTKPIIGVIKERLIELKTQQ